jgi:hypothetical protein
VDLNFNGDKLHELQRRSSLSQPHVQRKQSLHQQDCNPRNSGSVEAKFAEWSFEVRTIQKHKGIYSGDVPPRHGIRLAHVFKFTKQWFLDLKEKLVKPRQRHFFDR